MDVKLASHVPTLVGGLQRPHGVLHEESVSYRWHAEQMTNSCLNPRSGLASWLVNDFGQASPANPTITWE